MDSSLEVVSSAHQNKSGSVPSNYALILFGMFFFPILLFGLLFAKKRRLSGENWERTHYEMQYRSATLLLVIEVALFALGAGLIIAFPATTSQEFFGHQKIMILVSWIGYAALGWTAIRCVRGLFLAGGKNTLLFPKSCSVWPR